jgi:hypothetical protein
MSAILSDGCARPMVVGLTKEGSKTHPASHGNGDEFICLELREASIGL